MALKLWPHAAMSRVAHRQASKTRDVIQLRVRKAVCAQQHSLRAAKEEGSDEHHDQRRWLQSIDGAQRLNDHLRAKTSTRRFSEREVPLGACGCACLP